MPRGMYFSEFQVGAEFVTGRRTITETDVVMFAGLSGDFNPLHTDAVFAEKTPFKQRIAHGMLQQARQLLMEIVTDALRPLELFCHGGGLQRLLATSLTSKTSIRSPTFTSV